MTKHETIKTFELNEDDFTLSIIRDTDCVGYYHAVGNFRRGAELLGGDYNKVGYKNEAGARKVINLFIKNNGYTIASIA